MEVAESSLARDRGEKLTAYGRGGVPAYWIVNLIDRRVEVYANPVGGAYPPPVIFGDQESIELVIEGRVVGQLAVAEMLPRA